jgi:5-methylcytosine-specific restriction endonuclease McrA
MTMHSTEGKKHPPIVVLEAPCPFHGGKALLWRRYWGKKDRKYASSALTSCAPCGRNGYSLKYRMSTGEIVQLTKGSSKTECATDGCVTQVNKSNKTGKCGPCRQAARDAAAVEIGAIDTCQFRSCGEPLGYVVQVYANGVRKRIYCDALCAKAEREARRKEKVKARGNWSASDGSIKRRKRHRDERLALAFRDGYRCHICGDLVDLSLPANHVLAFTLDHVVPLDRGGADHPDNLSTAHRSCNSRKGAR